MHVRRSSLVGPRLVKLLAAVVVGLGIGSAVPPDPVALPLVGSVPGLVVGGLGVATGAVLYRAAPAVGGSTGCGCASDCDCS